MPTVDLMVRRDPGAGLRHCSYLQTRSAGLCLMAAQAVPGTKATSSIVKSQLPQGLCPGEECLSVIFPPRGSIFLVTHVPFVLSVVLAWREMAAVRLACVPHCWQGKGA